MNFLEKRMYFFVPYNLSPIQKGIQAGHAALEYADMYGNDSDFRDFVDRWKTWIILDGGTTNSKRNSEGIRIGSLNQIGDALIKNDIPFSYFEEPDLNEAVTAICFICDERVYNYEKYPDFLKWLDMNGFYNKASEIINLRIENSKEELLKFCPESYPKWVESLGGKQNVFLRELLKYKKLAQ